MIFIDFKTGYKSVALFVLFFLCEVSLKLPTHPHPRPTPTTPPPTPHPPTHTPLESLLVASLSIYFVFIQDVRDRRLPELNQELENLKSDIDHVNISYATAADVVANATEHAQNLTAHADKLARQVYLSLRKLTTNYVQRFIRYQRLVLFCSEPETCMLMICQLDVKIIILGMKISTSKAWFLS